MNIDKVGGISPIYEPKKPNKVSNVEPITSKQDKIEISEEARIQHLLNIIKETSNFLEPERAEQIKQIKQKLKEGFYDNLSEEILNKIADNLYESSLDMLKQQILRKK